MNLDLEIEIYCFCCQQINVNAKVDKETGYKTKTMLCIPIHGNNEGTSNLGVLQVVNKRDRTGKFNVRDASLLQLSVSILLFLQSH